MHEEMIHNGPEGFAVDPAALGPTQTMLGHEHLAGSAEFTRTCRVVLNTFFNAHNSLTEKQRALVQAVTTFRDSLAQSTATYLQSEADRARSLGNLSRQIEARLNSDGATG